MSIVVTTPTGQIGRRIVERLLDAGAPVTAFVRDPSRLDAAVRDRVTVRTGNLEDRASLTAALTGAEALFLLIPPNYGVTDWLGWQRAIGEHVVAALQATGVRRVVFLSSWGAHRPGLGPINGLGIVERLLQAAVPDVVSVRAGYFMENLFTTLDGLRAGQLYQPFPADLPLDFVATRDIGDVAAQWLLDRNWHGHHAIAAHGPARLTYTEVTRILGEVLGQPLTYVQVPIPAFTDALRGMGVSEEVARKYTEMVEGIISSRYAPDTDVRVAPGSIGQVTFEQFARAALAPALRAGATVNA